MSTTTDFIAELVRAANEVHTRQGPEKRRLLEQAIVTIRDMREEIGIPSSGTAMDAVVDIQKTVVLLIRGRATNECVKASLLDAADMVRTLHIVRNTETRILTTGER